MSVMADVAMRFVQDPWCPMGSMGDLLVLTLQTAGEPPFDGILSEDL